MNGNEVKEENTTVQRVPPLQALCSITLQNEPIATGVSKITVMVLNFTTISACLASRKKIAQIFAPSKLNTLQTVLMSLSRSWQEAATICYLLTQVSVNLHEIAMH